MWRGVAQSSSDTCDVVFCDSVVSTNICVCTVLCLEWQPTVLTYVLVLLPTRTVASWS